jgi:hypothetical protein
MLYDDALKIFISALAEPWSLLMEVKPSSFLSAACQSLKNQLDRIGIFLSLSNVKGDRYVEKSHVLDNSFCCMQSYG